MRHGWTPGCGVGNCIRDDGAVYIPTEAVVASEIGYAAPEFGQPVNRKESHR